MAHLRIPQQDDERSRWDAERELTRRDAIRGGVALVAGAGMAAQIMAATGAETALAETLRGVARGSGGKPGYGPLVHRTKYMTLPKDFRVVHFGRAGTLMSDGLRTPKNHDGTTAVSAGRGRVTLMRNQENAALGKALGKRNAYDRTARGGVTTSLFDTRKGKLLGSSLVLNGTDNNCNGGPTPWGSWLSCEESTVGKFKGFEKEHGYVFEVPFDATSPVEPVPIKAMGRFCHEACAIDPQTGIVYMTEDNGEPGDGFYRYLPDRPGKLHRGGKLQMLAVEGRSTYDTAKGAKVGRRLRTEWVTIDDPDPTDAERHAEHVYLQGREKGAARFKALEGATWSKGSVYFVGSEAGDDNQGQIWRYTPKGLEKGVLELLYESTSAKVLNQPDGIVVSPRGGVVVCEDGDGEGRDNGTNYIRYLTPKGTLEDFARNDTPLDLAFYEDEPKGTIGRSEWSGACFSPDRKWLFVHIQIPGETFAITGPWEKGWL